MNQDQFFSDIDDEFVKRVCEAIAEGTYDDDLYNPNPIDQYRRDVQSAKRKWFGRATAVRQAEARLATIENALRDRRCAIHEAATTGVTEIVIERAKNEWDEWVYRYKLTMYPPENSGEEPCITYYTEHDFAHFALNVAASQEHVEAVRKLDDDHRYDEC